MMNQRLPRAVAIFAVACLLGCHGTSGEPVLCRVCTRFDVLIDVLWDFRPRPYDSDWKRVKTIDAAREAARAIAWTLEAKGISKAFPIDSIPRCSRLRFLVERAALIQLPDIGEERVPLSAFHSLADLDTLKADERLFPIMALVALPGPEVCLHLEDHERAVRDDRREYCDALEATRAAFDELARWFEERLGVLENALTSQVCGALEDDEAALHLLTEIARGIETQLFYFSREHIIPLLGGTRDETAMCLPVGRYMRGSDFTRDDDPKRTPFIAAYRRGLAFARAQLGPAVERARRLVARLPPR